MSIRSRLLLLVLMFTAPLLASLLWYARITYDSELDSARVRLQTQAKLAVLDLEKAAGGGVQLLSGLGHAPALHGPRNEACDRLLADKFREFPKYTGILTFDLDGNLVCDALLTRQPRNFSQRDYFKRARATGQTVVGSPIFGGLTGRAVLPILHPLRDNSGRVEGYVYASYDLKRFAEELHHQLDSTAVFAIWGENATLMGRFPELPAWQGKSAQDKAVATFLAGSGDTGVAEFADLDGVNRLWAVAKMPSRDGDKTWITVGIDRNKAVAVAEGTTRPLLFAIAIGVVLAFAAVMLFADLVVRGPVNRLMESIRRFAGGDRSARIGDPYPHGELGELMRTADRIAEQAETEQKELEHLTGQLEHRVAERTAELKASNHELESFCHSVSHDLRAPLRHVQGFCAVLAADHAATLDADARHCVTRIQEATSRMGSLIDDLLHLSRVTRIDLRRENVNFSACTSRILEEIASREPGRHVTWRVMPDIALQADTGLLTIAMENILDNAWKFTVSASRPTIEVGARDNGPEMICWVRDNGAGFDMKYADKLFRPFNRLHREDEFPGTGIGLATVHRIITRMGGRVWIEGVVGQGATVFFALPKGDGDDTTNSAG